jgi:hypothetical protein
MKRGIGIAVATFALSLLGATEARAGEYYGGPELTYVLDVPAALFALPPVVANVSYVARGTQSPVGWRAFGYITGALCVVTGALTVYAFTGGSDTQGTGYAVGGSMIALGAADVALAVWSGSLPRAVVTPTAVTDVRGRLAPGASLQLLHF